MDKYTAVLIDDEFHSTELLEEIINAHVPNLSVVAKFNNAKDAANYIPKNMPDIIFLDIEMPGMNGFELIDALGDDIPDVIFITAYDRFAIKAIKFSAFDYILKPVDIEELKTTVTKWVEYKNERVPIGDIKYLVQLLKEKSGDNIDRIVLSMQDAYEVVPINDIVRIESKSNYCNVYIEDRSPLLIARTLKDFEETLSEKGFIRVHNSHLVNARKIKKFVKADGGHLEMTDGSIVYVSKSKKADIIRLFQQLL